MSKCFVFEVLVSHVYRNVRNQQLFKQLRWKFADIPVGTDSVVLLNFINLDPIMKAASKIIFLGFCLLSQSNVESFDANSPEVTNLIDLNSEFHYRLKEFIETYYEIYIFMKM